MPAPELPWKAIHRVADTKAGRFREAFLRNRNLIVNPEVQQALEAAFVEGRLDLAELAINWGSIEQPMRESFEDAITDTMRAAGRASEATLPTNASLRFDITNPAAVEFAKEHSANLVHQISDRSKKGIRRVIRDMFEQGIPPRDAARQIMPHIGLTERQSQSVNNFLDRQLALGVTEDVALKEADRYAGRALRRRATLIARTESIAASNQGQMALWDQAEGAGLLDKEKTFVEWIVTPDDRLDEMICLPMAGQRRRMGARFETGQGSMVDKPPAHPGCRCALGLVVEQ